MRVHIIGPASFRLSVYWRYSANPVMPCNPFTFTLNAYYSMFSGILRLHDPAFLAQMPKDLPLLFLAGDADPVGEQGKGVRRAIQSLESVGVQNIESKFYPGARHELLVETNRAEVFADIGDFVERHLP